MIVYIDTSALAKLYLAETESPAVKTLVEEADVTATSVLARVELSAAIAKAMRMKLITRASAQRVINAFRKDWPDFGALQITEAILATADRLAWEMGLRGYDAMHLASALIWQQAVDEPITLATFDHQLWAATKKLGIRVWPLQLG